MERLDDRSRRRVRRIAGSILFAAMLSLSCRPSAGTTLDVAVEEADNRPLEYSDGAGRLTGFHIELVRRVCAGLGWEAVFDRVPWQRAQALLEAGAVDAVTYLARTPAREAYAVFLPDNVLSENRFGLWVRKARAGDIRWDPPLSHMMTRWRVGGVQGWVYNEDYKAAESGGFPIDLSATTTVALARMLLAGRIDVALAEMGFVGQVAAELPDIAEQVQSLQEPILRGSPVYIAFARNGSGAETARSFAEAHARWRKTAAYRDLVRQFAVADRVDFAGGPR